MSNTATPVLRVDEPPRPLYGAQPVGDPILDAAAICVRTKGFDNTSLEEVAAEAGVSRTTLYRRFGNREALFTALLWARSRPFREWTRSVLIAEGSVADRLETVLLNAVLEIQRVGWLDATLRSGISPLGTRLFINSFSQGADEGLGLLISTLLGSGTGHGDIATGEVLEWVARQMIELAREPDWDEQRLRQRVRFFVIPVLTSAPAEPRLAERLDAIEDKLERLMRVHGQSA